MDDILREIITKLITESDYKYDLTKNDINDIVYQVNNEELWDFIENKILDVLDFYREDEEDE